MSSHILNMCSPQEYYSICEMGNRYVKEFSATPPTLNYIVYNEPRPVVSGYPIQTGMRILIFFISNDKAHDG